MRQVVKLLAAVMLFAGCGVSQLSVPATALEARIKFTGEGGVLKLEQRSYPNPDGLEWLEARVKSNGEIQVSCLAQTSIEQCTNSPLITRISTGQGGPMLQILDVFGDLLAEIPFTGCAEEDDSQGGADAGTSGELGTVVLNLEQAPIRPPNCDFTSDDGSFDDGFFGADGGVFDDGFFGADDGGFSSDDGGSGSDEGQTCTTIRDELKAQFCQKLNDRLQQLQLEYTYDCAHLDQDPELERPEEVMNEELGCRRDVVEPVRDDVTEQLEQEHGFTCWGVQLDLMQWSNRAYQELVGQGVCGMSPLVLDLDGNGIELTRLSEGVEFDLLANGSPVRTAWVGAGDALLVLDRNGNGLVDDASELFGNRTDRRSHTDGFAALAELDANADGIIDPRDPAFTALRVWADEGRDGIGTRNEWRTLAQAGVASLSLEARSVSGLDAFDGKGNRIPLRAGFTRTDGSGGELVDAVFRYEPRPAERPELLACSMR